MEAMVLRPKVFIGSAVEGLDIAKAIQANLEHDTEPTVWNQGIFRLSHANMDNLLRALSTYDFGVFVVSAQDMLKLRGQEFVAARDNVIFELGLFMGHLGPERTFFVLPRISTDLRIPTDLLGIEPATYEPNRQDSNLQAALAPACERILREIRTVAFWASEPDATDQVSLSRTREQHYKFAIELIEAAKLRIYLIERTPVLLFGPRHYWYEKRYHDALKRFVESTLFYENRTCRCMLIARDSIEELNSTTDRSAVRERLHEYKELERKSEGRFELLCLPHYYGSFLVADNSTSIWFKGTRNAISIVKQNSPSMAKIFVEIFGRLAEGLQQSEDQMASQLGL